MLKTIITFTSLFLSTQLFAKMNELEFQDYVIDYVSENFDRTDLKKSKDATYLILDEYELGLQNIYSNYIEYSNDAQLPNDLDTHFSAIFKKIDAPKTISFDKWDNIKELVRIQIVSISFLEKSDIAHEKFDDHAIIAFVIDSESGYQYILETDIEKWKISQSSLKQIAIDNLQKNSKGINIQGSLDGDKYLIITTGDGYDAARIQLPELRTYIGSLLNFPYYAAIPNRDFIIFWSQDSSDTFTNKTKQQVALDFKNDAYPITDLIFDADLKVLQFICTPVDIDLLCIHRYSSGL